MDLAVPLGLYHGSFVENSALLHVIRLMILRPRMIEPTLAAPHDSSQESL